MLLLFPTLSTSLVVGPAGAPRASGMRMKLVDDFQISKVVKDVSVFDGGYDADICDTVAAVAKDCLAEKGSFSLCIPGGSVVKALGGLTSDSFDMSKTHIFFANEKIPSYPCIEGALEQTGKLGVPEENVHGVGNGTPPEIAARYSALLKSHPSIDNSGTIPSFDMMLLGTGPDGHCGCLFPESPEIMATGSGEVMIAGNNANADGDFVAITMDVMCGAKTVIVSAAGAGRAPMVTKALSGEFGAYDCPAGMVEAQEETLWFVDTESIAEFEGDAEQETEEGQ